MIFAHGGLLPDGELPHVLAHLEEEINGTRQTRTLPAERVIDALDGLGKRLSAGEFDALLARYLPAGTGPEALLPLLDRKSLEEKLCVELGPEPFAPRPMEGTVTRTEPLGTLFHVTAGNVPGLPVYSAVEGLLTGNVNLVKLPHGDKGLSLAALSLLTDAEPALADFLYAFDLPSSDRESLVALAALADGVVTWGGDGAVAAVRALAPAGCRLIEWGHRLSFAYIAGYEDRERELAGLARNIIGTGQRLCSSCQVIFLDTEDQETAERFCRAFLPMLESESLRRSGPGALAQSTLSGYTAFLERAAGGRTAGEFHYPGRGCSVTLRPDRELELSPMEGNVLVKALPRRELLGTLRRQKGRLQTAGLLCARGEREELTQLLCRAGVTRITRAGRMSETFPGEGHDGEYPLRRYVRMVDVER